MCLEESSSDFGIINKIVSVNTFHIVVQPTPSTISKWIVVNIFLNSSYYMFRRQIEICGFGNCRDITVSDVWKTFLRLYLLTT